MAEARAFFPIELAPTSEQHLAAWQLIPHVIGQQHQGLLDRFHGVFFPQLSHLGHILTGYWKEAKTGMPRAL